MEAAHGAVETLEAKHSHAKGRIGLVTGDITVQGLGIEAHRAKELRRTLAQAWHLAAVYDLAVARDVGRRINVEGTRNVLEFVSEARRFERLDYVSTAYVSGTALGTFRETDLDVGQCFKNYYEETKFQAEVEVVPVEGAADDLPARRSWWATRRRARRRSSTGRTSSCARWRQLPSPGVFVRSASATAP